MKKFSKNKKLNYVLNDIYSYLMEMGKDDIKRYMKDFSYKADYNIYQYGNMRVYNDEIKELYLSGFSSNKIEEVKNLIQDKQIKYIYSTSSKSNETVSGLIDEYHLDLVPINTMHSTDGNITSSNDNYLTIMTNNINQLKKELYK